MVSDMIHFYHTKPFLYQNHSQLNHKSIFDDSPNYKTNLHKYPINDCSI